MPQFIFNSAEPITFHTGSPMIPGEQTIRFDDLAPMVRGYIEAMFFTDTGPDQAEDGLGPDCAFSDLAPETVAKVQHRCALFAEVVNDAIAPGLTSHGFEQIGRDLHYTSNGHGVGFWDRPEIYGQANADLFSDAARKLGGRDLYRGDDGKLYLS